MTTEEIEMALQEGDRSKIKDEALLAQAKSLSEEIASLKLELSIDADNEEAKAKLVQLEQKFENVVKMQVAMRDDVDVLIKEELDRAS